MGVREGAIHVAIVGVGNCASALVQGLAHYRSGEDEDQVGLANSLLADRMLSDIAIKLAFDVDARKVGLDLHEAIFSAPNCTAEFCSPSGASGTIVKMGRVLDGVARHMLEPPSEKGYVVSDDQEPDIDEIVLELKRNDVEVVVNYLPVGSIKASQYYAQAAIQAGCAFVNCVPVFIASDKRWASKFEREGLPVLGDDIKSQVGATILHRTLTELFLSRGAVIDRSYQLSTGGNTDFRNMLDRERTSEKVRSKTEAVDSVLSRAGKKAKLKIAPAEYVEWQNDHKVCFLRIEGRNFGGVPLNLEIRLDVEDSPNSAAAVVDLIRCASYAKRNRMSGAIEAASAVYCKRPPVQMNDGLAIEMLARWVGN